MSIFRDCRRPWILAAFFTPAILLAQLTTGTIEGTVTMPRGALARDAPIFLRGEPNYHRMLRADERRFLHGIRLFCAGFGCFTNGKT